MHSRVKKTVQTRTPLTLNRHELTDAARLAAHAANLCLCNPIV